MTDTTDLTNRLAHLDSPATSELLAAALDRADAEGLVDVAWASVDSPIGPLTVAATEVGLVRLGFADEDGVLEDLAAHVSPRVVRAPKRLDDVRRQLEEYFEQRRHDFALVLDHRLSHGFRRTVLEHLAHVPYGSTVTYRDLAVESGSPGASRAVGTAMATNPIPIVLPCHRVLRTGGGLGGYGGGLEVKEYLLRLEGAIL
jgi:methylated-DNA-[protein]-cysteine S-methyltransferase